MAKKRAGKPGGKAPAAQVGPKRPRPGSLSPVDPEFLPVVEGRARGSSSTPLKSLRKEHASSQRQAMPANADDDGMASLDTGADIPDAVPADGAAVAQPAAPAAGESDENPDENPDDGPTRTCIKCALLPHA